MQEIIEYIKSLPMEFIVWFFVWYTVRVFVWRLNGVRYSIKNLFRLFK